MAFRKDEDGAVTCIDFVLKEIPCPGRTYPEPGPKSNNGPVDFLEEPAGGAPPIDRTRANE